MIAVFENLVSAMSPFSNVNPIFAVNVVKISQDWFYFKQVSFWMRDDSLWANGSEVWLYFSGSFWCHQLQSEPSLSMCQMMDPTVTLQDINAVDRSCKTYDDYHFWIWYGRLSPDITDKRTSTVCWAQPYLFFLKKILHFVSTRQWVLTCLALGEPS